MKINTQGKKNLILTDINNDDYIISDIDHQTVTLKRVNLTHYKILPFASYFKSFKSPLIFEIGGHKIQRNESKFTLVK
jgi:hypothetical protein